MSRTRTYGKVVAVQLTGPDAVSRQSLRKTTDRAAGALSRHFAEMVRILSFAGVELDTDTYATDTRRSADGSQQLFSYTISGRQKRNVLKRIIWAIKL